jgi:hypothetical protein
MSRGGDGAGGRLGAENFAMAAEWRVQLDADFQVDHVIQVDSYMTARPGNLLRADDAPYSPAGVRNNAGEVLRSRATAYHRERTTDMLLDADVVFHAGQLNLETFRVRLPL